MRLPFRRRASGKTGLVALTQLAGLPNSPGSSVCTTGMVGSGRSRMGVFVGGTAVGGTAVGGTLVGGMLVGGMLVGGTKVAGTLVAAGAEVAGACVGSG